MDILGAEANELAGLIVTESLAGLGIENIVISPGSRSTALTYAFAKDPRFKTHVVLDERSAGFFALGKAKASGEASVLICTSGTAAANYLPAIVEARYSHTPLLVITADRPLMEQFCHAGQTIQQQGLYANFVNHEQQLELPQANFRYLKYLRETIRESVWKCHSPQSGVVHLNFPFVEPLAPKLPQTKYHELKQTVATQLFTSPLHKPEKISASGDISVERFLQTGLRCVWIMGPSYKASDDARIERLLVQLKRHKVPVLIDVLNSARGSYRNYENVIQNYEWLLNPKAENRESLRFDVFFQLGNLPTSKSLRSAITDWDVHRVVVDLETDNDNRDPTFSRTLGNLSMEEAISQLVHFDFKATDKQSIYFETWINQQQKVEKAIQETCDSSAWVEPVICRKLEDLLTEPCDLFISNSMVVRDMENFFRGSSKIRKVFSNRGANGIDGIVSTAFGTADSKVPLVCLLGDLTFLHDSGAMKLLHAIKRSGRILFIILNNKGGGIFEHLPVAALESTFEAFFATPQAVNIRAVCRAYEVECESIDNIEAFELAVESFFNSTLAETDPCKPVLTCLDLDLDRKRSFQFRRSLFAEVLK